MKILFVSDQFFDANNGVTISARRFAAILVKHGHEVRPLSVANKDQNIYHLETYHLPVFDKIITEQGMKFAKWDDLKTIHDAVAWADFVHIYMPFELAKKTILQCQEQKKPFTMAFHVQPENVSSSIHMGTVKPVNDFIYWLFKNWTFKYATHIHCPSQMIANQLKAHDYKAKLHVISNGIDPDFVYRKIPKTPDLQPYFCILTVGRYSIEKRQDILIEAVNHSKYKDKIQLILAGQGPRAEHLEHKGQILPVKPIMKFFTKPELLDIIAMSDLYVHASQAEIEAMSCMEAFAGGLVPVIANSTMSATPQFALCEESLFPVDDVKALAQRIDWWIEHEDYKKKMEVEYAESAKKYSLDACVTQAEEMFQEAIDDFNKAQAEQEQAEQAQKKQDTQKA